MIFVNGIQRSGTNFVKSLFKDSTDFVYPYWKHHAKLEGINPNCDRVICIIKNPYTWVESICFRDCVDIISYYSSYYLIYKMPEDKSHEFIGEFNIHLPRLCQIYKLFYMSWLNYKKTELIHYEDLLTDDNIHIIVPQGHDWVPSRAEQYKKYEAPLITREYKDIINNVLGEEFFNLIKYQMQ